MNGLSSTTVAEDAIDHPEVAEDEAAAMNNVEAEVVEIKDNPEEAVDHHEGAEGDEVSNNTARKDENYLEQDTKKYISSLPP